MSLNQSSSEFRLEAAELIYGPSYCRSRQFSADSSSDTNNGYIDVNYSIFSDANGLEEVQGYIWFSVGGAGVDPAPAGKTLIAEASYAADATAEERVDAIISALDALVANPFFYYKKQGTDVIVFDNAYPNEQTAESDSSSNSVLTVLRDGFGRLFGSTKEAITIEASIIDVSQEAKEVLIGKSAGDIIDLGGGINAVGLGESRLFQNASDIGGRMILHPIRLSRSDRSSDFVMWNTIPQLTELAFDGTDTQAIGISAGANLDSGINKKVNLCVFGEEWIDNGLLA